jgi:hypothetical protein
MLVSMYQGYQQIFTDGSKNRSAVSSAAVTEGKVLALRVTRSLVSIFSGGKSGTPWFKNH